MKSVESGRSTESRQACRSLYRHAQNVVAASRACRSPRPQHASARSCTQRLPAALVSSSSGTRQHVACHSGWLDDAIAARSPVAPDSSLINDDLAPTLPSQRSFSTYDLAALWVGLVVSIPTYYLAGGLVEMGMSWWQGILTVFIGNIITLAPMVLNAHPGTKYGIPFPVLARASFGVHGACLPALLRALVATGWFGIQTWVGGSALHSLAMAVAPAAVQAPMLAWLGLSLPQFGCFMVFWVVQAAIIVRGIESIKLVEQYGAPILIAMSAALLAWAYSQAGGWGPMLSAPSQFAPGMPMAGQFWPVFVSSITANVGFWATLSLNIPDFTRYARSQRAQVMGQALGLPFFMAAFTFVGLAVTSATVTMYGSPISDPIALLSKQQGLASMMLSLGGLMLATLTTNIAANVVAPANALVNLAPDRISFTAGALFTAVLGVLIMPWRLVASTHGFIFTWLIGYSVVLGPVGGVLIADYFLLRKRTLDIDALYSASPDSKYWYQGGWNLAAVAALLIGAAPSIPGFLAEVAGLKVAPFFVNVYRACWFVGFGLSSASYYVMMQARGEQGMQAALQ